MSKIVLLSVLLIGLAVHDVYGWGTEGHALVVHLAESQLTKEASDWIKTLLPWFVDGNLTSVASWADDIIHDNSNHFGYQNWQWSKALHYIDLPDWVCDYDAQRDCIDDVCVDGALRNYSKRIIAADLDRIQHQEALMFLVHFAGDVHQPLHVSFIGDRGGNTVKGFFMGEKQETNLHSIWDTRLIRRRMSLDFQSNINLYYEYLYDQTNKQTNTINANDFKLWIDESIKIVCEQVYLDENNSTMNASVVFHLGDIYYERNIPIIEERLIQAGRRLGSLLNNLATQRSEVASPSEKLCSGMIALIAILAIEFVAVIGIVVILTIVRRRKLKTASYTSPFSITQFSSTKDGQRQ